MHHRIRSVVMGWAFLAGASQCVFEPIDLTGYRCASQSECSAGLVCELATQTCRPAQAGPSVGSSVAAGSAQSTSNAPATSSSTGAGPGNVELLVSGEVNPGPIAVDSERVVWGPAELGGTKSPLRGCGSLDCSVAPVDYSIPQLSTRAVLLDAGSIFVSRDAMLEKCDASTCKATAEYFLFNHVDPYGIAVDDTTIYFADDLRNGVYKCAKNVGCGAGPTAILGGGQAHPFGIVVTADFVYWSNVSQVLRCPLSGCPSGEHIVENGARAFARDAARLYWATYATGGVVKSCELSDCKATITELAIDQSFPTTIASDGEHVYWSSRGQNRVKRCQVTGCDLNPEDVALDQDQPFGIALSNTHVYWTNWGSGTIMRASK